MNPRATHPPRLHARIRCELCQGTGIIERINPAWLRWRRERAGLSLRSFADRLRFSAAYLCDIELGRRNVTAKILTAYEGLT